MLCQSPLLRSMIPFSWCSRYFSPLVSVSCCDYQLPFFFDPHHNHLSFHFFFFFPTVSCFPSEVVSYVTLKTNSLVEYSSPHLTGTFHILCVHASLYGRFSLPFLPKFNTPLCFLHFQAGTAVAFCFRTKPQFTKATQTKKLRLLSPPNPPTPFQLTNASTA